MSVENEKRRENMGGNNSELSDGSARDSREPVEMSKIIEWVNGLKDEKVRGDSLVQLSKKREAFPDLAIFLWYTPGIISVLLQEIIDTYKLLAPPNMTTDEANHTCNVLVLFQCIAAHSETRPHLLNAQIPIFFYPFLNTVNKSKPFEYLRLTALGVIGALVKTDNSDVINFLLSTEIIPLCLRIIERGSELSKTVATFIVQRILLDENGLNYVCNTAERFYAVSSVLLKIISGNPSSRLIKHIVRCYARLSENPRVNTILKDNLPPVFIDKIFIASLDESSRKWIQVLMKNIMFHTSNQNSTHGTQQKSASFPGGNNGSVYNEISNSLYTYPQNQFNNSNNSNIHPFTQNGGPNDYYYFNGPNGQSYNLDNNNSSSNTSSFPYKTFNASGNLGYYNNNKN